MGGSKTKTLVNRKATAKRQAQSDIASRRNFATNYVDLFAPGGGSPVNSRFAESLGGYYGGAEIDDIAQMLAKRNAFLPKVKPVTYKKKVGGGLFSGGNLLAGALSGGLSLAPDVVGSQLGGPTSSDIFGDNFNLF